MICRLMKNTLDVEISSSSLPIHLINLNSLLDKRTDKHVEASVIL